MTKAVSTHNLSRKFGNFIAVNEVSLDIPTGSICGFLGHNGAGKTTLIRMLCGILEPTSGSAKVLGYDIKSQAEKIKNRIGYMSQKFSLYDDLSVIENLQFFSGIYGLKLKEREIRIEEMLVMAGLTGQENIRVSQLSPGHRQRLALASALLSRPSLLFLDEPTSGVSPVARREFFNIIQRLSHAGVTVIVSTHFMDEAERCDLIAFMSQGQLLAFASPEELKLKTVKGTLIEIQVPRPREMQMQLKNISTVKECFIYGSYLHVLLEHPKDIEQIEKICGCPAIRITPSLQETFLTLAHKIPEIKTRGELNV